jgi:hypothetical protein
MNCVKAAFVLPALFNSFSIFSLPESLSVAEAAKRGLVNLEIKSKGGYTGQVIEMAIRNLSGRALNLFVEAGRRLDSKKQTEQDILVTKREDLYVAAGQKKNFNVHGMCCQAHNSAPSTAALYSTGEMADSNLVKLASFIDMNKWYNDHTAQQAVWSVSDNESIGAITSSDTSVQNQLRRFVSRITGRKIPAYEVRFGNGDGADLLGKATRLDAVFNYSLPANGHATIGIFDESGKMVQSLMNDMSHERGEYKLFYSFRTRDLPKGRYYTRLLVDGITHSEAELEF